MHLRGDKSIFTGVKIGSCKGWECVWKKNLTLFMFKHSYPLVHKQE